MFNFNMAAVADLHFRGFRLNDIETSWFGAVQDMKNHQVKLCMIAGDIFHKCNIASREASMGTIYRAFMGPAKELLASGCEIIAVMGNHDLATGDQKSALEPLKDAGIKVFDTLDFFWKNDPINVVVAALPWMVNPTPENIASAISKIQDAFSSSRNAVKVLLGHCQVDGSITPAGYTLVGGKFPVTEDQLRSTGADIIALGDIHKRQGYYVGALTQQSFGDESNPTGYDLYTIEDGKIRKEFREITSTRYRTIEITGAIPEDALPDNDKYDASYVKLRFHREYTKEEIKPFLTHPHYAQHYQIEKAIERRAVSRTEKDLSAQDDPITLLKTYVGLHPRETKGMEKELIIEAEKLLQEVKA